MRTILHTIETGGPGGAETVLLEIASRLNPKQYRSVVLLSRDGWLHEQLRARQIETTLVNWKAWYDFRLPRAMAELVRRERVDLIHSHLPDHNFYSCLVGPWLHRPTIVTYHGAVELTRARRARDRFKRWVVRRNADTVVVVCDSVGRMLTAAGFEPDRLVRIYNGIEPARFTEAYGTRLREELGCGPGTQLVGTVANIRETKGYEFLIPAAGRVLDAFPRALFLSIGDDHEKLGGPLRAEVERLGLKERFRFLGFRSDVPRILSELDVFVLPSTSEGFPLVVLEAMAAGKPVVVTRCGGPEEVVSDGSDGFLVPPGDATALAEKIRSLLANAALGARMGAAGRAKIERDFSLDRMVEAYEHLYERCLHVA